MSAVYEPVGRAFESLRARKKFQGLTSKKRKFFFHVKKISKSIPKANP
jgi:hypothetical protein